MFRQEQEEEAVSWQRQYCGQCCKAFIREIYSFEIISFDESVFQTYLSLCKGKFLLNKTYQGKTTFIFIKFLRIYISAIKVI